MASYLFACRMCSVEKIPAPMRRSFRAYVSPALVTSAGPLLWEAKSSLVELLFTAAAVALQRRT